VLDESVYHIWCALLHVAKQEATPVLCGRIIACSAARRLPPRGALCAAPPPGCGLGVLGRRRARAVRQPGQPRSAHRQPRLEELRAQHGGKAAPLPGGSGSGSHRGHGLRQALGRSVLSVRARPEARGDPTLPSRGQSSPGWSIGLRIGRRLSLLLYGLYRASLLRCQTTRACNRCRTFHKRLRPHLHL